ncbi:unnamed protein product [Auanema sp. JU1783]|nr:unnamed protein product [Auanema sp. JU1783]
MKNKLIVVLFMALLLTDAVNGGPAVGAICAAACLGAGGTLCVAGAILFPPTATVCAAAAAKCVEGCILALLAPTP